MRPSTEIHRKESLLGAIAALSFFDAELTENANGPMETFPLKRLGAIFFFYANAQLTNRKIGHMETGLKLSSGHNSHS